VKKAISFLIAAAILAALSITAFAAEIPNRVVTENRDGRQLIVKTYTLAPDVDPSELSEEPFELEGFSYAQISITKEEKPFTDTKSHSETLTVNTETDDLSAILEALAPILRYSSDGYAGTLSLDHTSIVTEVTGYSNSSFTVTDTKVIDNLDRNDPSYIPQTTVKNGRTLNLSNIDWSVQGTGLSDDSLVPTIYSAVATYSGSGSSKVADGYVTTAMYSGNITANGISEIVYTVTFLGTVITPAEIPGLPIDAPEATESIKSLEQKSSVPTIIAVAVAAALLIAVCAFAGLYIQERGRSANLRKELYFGSFNDISEDMEEAE